MKGCSVRGCREIVGDTTLMCATHWSQLPEFMKSYLYRQQTSGNQELYRDAAKEAVGFLNRRMRSM